MTIEHHPDEAHALGLCRRRTRSRPAGRACDASSRMPPLPRFRRALECVGGVLLDECRPRQMAAGALRRVARRVSTSPGPGACAAAARDGRCAAGLPAFVRRLRFRPLALRRPAREDAPDPSARAQPTRVFLLKSARSTELCGTSIGARDDLHPVRRFRHDGGRYGPGDFDLGDDSVSHEPHIEDGGDCVPRRDAGGLRWRGSGALSPAVRAALEILRRAAGR